MEVEGEASPRPASSSAAFFSASTEIQENGSDSQFHLGEEEPLHEEEDDDEEEEEVEEEEEEEEEDDEEDVLIGGEAQMAEAEAEAEADAEDIGEVEDDEEEQVGIEEELEMDAEPAVEDEEEDEEEEEDDDEDDDNDDDDDDEAVVEQQPSLAESIAEEIPGVEDALAEEDECASRAQQVEEEDTEEWDIESMSEDQLGQLKILLQATGCILRGMPLSRNLLQSVGNVHGHWARNQNMASPAQEQDMACEQQIANSMEERTDKVSKSKENDKGPGISDACRGILQDGYSTSSVGSTLADFEDAIACQRPKFTSAAALRKEEDFRLHSKVARRLQELQGLSLDVGENVQRAAQIELRTLKLLAIQKKVRFEVAAEQHFQQLCSKPETMLFDWGLMRLRQHFAAFMGIHTGSSILGLESDERLRRKKELERQKRMEEEEQARIATRKRKFFNELLNLVREFQLQCQATSKLQKQRNDGILAWHAKQKQRATRAEKLRFQALKSDDQEAYMKMVEESKNERLMTLLSKTDDLLQRLGAMVQKQKDAEPEDNFRKERHREKGKDWGNLELGSPRPRLKEGEGTGADVVSPKGKLSGKDGADEIAGHEIGKKRDFLEGQRQYNFAVHQIEEKVTEQPAMLEGGELRTYQLEGLQWMLSLYNNNLNGILADEMGLGKTIQTIALLAYLMENKGLSGPHIIVAPKAVLPNWSHEFRTWAPSMIIVVYDGRLDERKALREEYGRHAKFNVLITHYDLIMRDKAFLKKIRWHYMVVDEGHRLKNHESMLARTLAAGYHIRRRLLLTGTPIQNSLQELWSLLNFLLPAIFNSSQNFEDWFNAPFADRSEVSLTEEEQLLVIRRLHQVIRPFLLRRKKSEVEKFLPGKVQVILKCDLSAWQRLYYQQVISEGRVGLDSGTGKSKGLQNTAMQLRKCCNHPYLFLEGTDYVAREQDEIVRASGKFELLDRLLPKLRRTGHRVLLFSQMTRLMDVLERYLNWRGFMYLRLDGTTKTEDRGYLLQEFNAPDSPYFMFLLSTRAGGLGLNLQTADTVILFDSDWNPQMDQQAEDRAHRIGQKKEVHVFVLVSVGSIEEEILERAKSKMGIDAKVIQAGLFNTTSTAQERREMLEEIMRRGTNALSTDVPSEREINRLAARSEEEFLLFEEMDEDRRNNEGYRSRLMEEREVPDWVFLRPEDVQQRSFQASVDQLSAKRQRKEVVYADVLSDSQWLKAVEHGEDVSEMVKSKISRKLKNQEMENAEDIEIAEYRSSRVVDEYETEAPSSSADDSLIMPYIKSGNTPDWKKLRRKRSKYQESGEDSAQETGQGSDNYGSTRSKKIVKNL